MVRAKRSNLRIEKESENADGTLPRDSAGQPNRRWLAVTTVKAKKMVGDQSDEDFSDDRERPRTHVTFEFYKPEDEIKPSMRAVETSNNDKVYDIREVKEFQTTPPKKLRIEAFTDEF